MSRPGRRLFLHLSALSDAEYDVYSEALHDVLDDADTFSEDELEGRQIGVREARAWMRGRFRDVRVAEIDKILALLTPQKDSITGGQFLAALRLLTHARHGAEVVESNVFVQADPTSPTSTSAFPAFTSPNTSDPPTPDLPASTSTSTPARTRQRPVSTMHTPNTNPFILDPPPPAVNYSTRRASLSSAPPVPSPHSKPAAPPALPASLSAGTTVSPGSTNPFLQRAKTHSGSTRVAGPAGRAPPLPPLPPRKPSHVHTAAGGPTPVFPPPPLKSITSPPPPRSPPKPAALTLAGAGAAPPHLVTPLMKQSLEASKYGQTLKRAQSHAERERVLEVIRSSASAPAHAPEGARGRTSRSPTKGLEGRVGGGGGRRPVPSPPRSAFSAGSFDQVAGATLLLPGSGVNTRMASPDRMSMSASSSAASYASHPRPDHDTAAAERDRDREAQHLWSTPATTPSMPHTAPPTHPDRRPSTGARGGGAQNPRHQRSPSYQSAYSAYSAKSQPSARPAPLEDYPPAVPAVPRPTRSHSMHQTPSPSPTSGPGSGPEGHVSPPLPPPRRRPESVQLTPRSRGAGTDDDAGSPFTHAFAAALARSEERVGSQSGGTGTGLASFGALQRTLAQLQTRAAPTLERARYKAEAGLSRRGFVPNGAHHHGHRGALGAGADGGSADSLVHDGAEGDGGGMDVGGGGGGSPYDDDDEWGSASGDDGTVRGRGRRGVRGGAGMDGRDNLKLPEGEGWVPL